MQMTPDEMKAYLDNAIINWRKQRDEENNDIAQYYIDAFQSVRVSVFGELLP